MVAAKGRKPGRKPVLGLTATLERTLGGMADFIAKERMSPSVQELAALLGIAVPSAHEQIRNLEKKGFIRRTKGRSRSIEVIKGPHRVNNLVTIPVVGRVAAGMPILAVENIIGNISVPARDARGRSFALNVVGDSMVDAGIKPGDYLVVRQQPIAENGDIVVAVLDEEEATVKRLFISDEHIELRPANAAYHPIRIEAEDPLRIVGKVTAVIASDTTTLHDSDGG